MIVVILLHGLQSYRLYKLSSLQEDDQPAPADSYIVMLMSLSLISCHLSGSTRR